VPKPAGVYRILALGGSTTFGHALAVDETWPAQFERILHNDYGYTQVEVVNLGVPGYFSLDSVVNLATHGLAHEPDLVMVYHGINDAIIRMFQDPACYQGESPLFGMALDRGIWQYAAADLPPSTLYRVVAYALGAFDDPSEFDSRLEPTGLCPPEPQGISPLDVLAQNPPSAFERNLRSIAGMSRAVGAETLFSTFAWDVPLAEDALRQNPDYFQLQAQLQGIAEQNDLIRQLAAELDVAVVDLAAEIGTGPYFQGDMVHQTVEGARRQAEIYAAYLDVMSTIPR
jgi:lysophospholipase L1-like esterase